MSVGDNWIGQVVPAIQADTKDWSSTAIFITWDACGWFSDHVPPDLTKSHVIQQPVSPALEQQVQATKDDPNDPT